MTAGRTRHSRRRAALPALMLATALATLTVVPAAQAADKALPVASSAAKDDAPAKGWLQIDADHASYDPDTKIYSAQGHVVIQYEGRTLYADEVTYDQASNEVTAKGDVVLKDPSGAQLATSEVMLTSDLATGVIKGLQAVLPDGSQLAAESADRTGGNRTVLHYAVYSPCTICDGQEPLWQIKARKVIHDEATRTLMYRDAVMEVKGVPIFYVPYLEHPDPTVDRRTGLLTPNFTTDSLLGVSVELPFYWAPSATRDFTFTPKITSNEGVILFGEYRENVGFGTQSLSGSVTHPDRRDAMGNRTGTKIWRAHVFGNGRYDLGNKWNGGFDIAWASDDTYLRRYDISRADSLTNNFFVSRYTDHTLLSIDSYAFQGLRQEDVQNKIPVILPMINYEYNSPAGWQGSRWSVRGNFLAMHRVEGVNMYRWSGKGSWAVPYTNDLGQQFRLTTAFRGDLYLINDPNNPGSDYFEGRAAPSVALDWSWPFARTDGHFQHVIEPVVSVVAAPEESNPQRIPNEDSIDVQFSDLNLFSHDRSPGLDIWESGVRATYGLRYSLFSDTGVQGSMLLGQSWRISGQSPFPENSGLGSDRSDLVMGLMLAVPGWLELHESVRLDQRHLKIQKNQLQLFAGPPKLQVRLGYLDAAPQGFDLSLPRREEINLGAHVKLSDDWAADGVLIQSFDKSVNTIEWEFGLTYESRCLRLQTTLRRNFAEDRDIRPSTTLFVKISLLNLGS